MSLYIVPPEVQVVATVQGVDLVAILSSFIYPRKLIRLNIIGPSASRFVLYKHGIAPANQLDSTPRGDNNTAEYSADPIDVGAGVLLVGQWPGVSGNAYATFFLKEG